MTTQFIGLQSLNDQDLQAAAGGGGGLGLGQMFDKAQKIATKSVKIAAKHVKEGAQEINQVLVDELGTP